MKPNVVRSVGNDLRADPLIRVMLKVAAAARPGPEHLGALRVPPQDFKENIRTLIAMARARNSKVLLLTTAVNMPDTLQDAAKRAEVLRITKDVARYNDALRDVALETGTPVGDIDEWFAGAERSTLFVDPIHFSSEGNGIIAEHLYDILRHTGL